MTVPLRGSRCECTDCGEVFSGEGTFDMHRTGTFEPLNRRCLSKAEIVDRGMVLKPSGVWGRPGSTGAELTSPTIRRRTEAA